MTLLFSSPLPTDWVTFAWWQKKTYTYLITGRAARSYQFCIVPLAVQLSCMLTVCQVHEKLLTCWTHETCRMEINIRTQFGCYYYQLTFFYVTATIWATLKMKINLLNWTKFVNFFEYLSMGSKTGSTNNIYKSMKVPIPGCKCLILKENSILKKRHNQVKNTFIVTHLCCMGCSLDSLSQTTNFTLFETERVCRPQF